LQQAIVALQEATLRAAAKMWTATTLDLTPKIPPSEDPNAFWYYLIAGLALGQSGPI
jgi:hypothetical protein